MGIYPFDRHGSPTLGRTHVPTYPGRAGSSDPRAWPLRRCEATSSSHLPEVVVYAAFAGRSRAGSSGAACSRCRAIASRISRAKSFRAVSSAPPTTEHSICCRFVFVESGLAGEKAPKFAHRDPYRKLNARVDEQAFAKPKGEIRSRL